MNTHNKRTRKKKHEENKIDINTKMNTI